MKYFFTFLLTIYISLSAAVANAQFRISEVPSGGTGRASFTSSGVIYGNGTGALNVTAACSNGQVIKYSGGVPACGSDNTGGGGGGSEVNWAYLTVESDQSKGLVYVSTTTNQVAIGASATTTKASLEIYEVNTGFGALFVNSSTTLKNFTFVNATGTQATTTNLFSSLVTATNATISSLLTTANLLTTSSSTLQNFTFVNATGSQATTSALAISTITSSLLKTNGSGSIVPAISGTDYESSLTAGDGLTRTANDFDCDIASGSVFGCLSSTDWTTFNNKVGTSLTLTAGDGLTGGGDLSSNRTFNFVGDSTLSVSADSVGINLGNGNLWTALQRFYGNASTTALSANFFQVGTTSTTTLWGNATSTFSGGANIVSGGFRISTMDCSGFSNGGALTTDASGNLVCTADDSGAGGTPGGADTQVQFNDGGSFGGNANLTFQKNTGLLSGLSSIFTFSTTTNLLATGSSTLQNFTFVNATGTQATTTNLAVSSIPSSLVKTNSSGSLIPATAEVDYLRIKNLSINVSSTTWTSTTTELVASAPVALTFTSGRCFTDTGTVDVSLYDGTNRLDLIVGASSGGVTKTFTTNNTFTAGEKIMADVGNPVGSPTKLACTASSTPQ